MKINFTKSETIVMDNSIKLSEAPTIRRVESTKYLGMTIFKNTKDTIRTAWACTKRYLGFVKGKLRQVNPEVKEAILSTYARSLLIYYGTPLAAAGYITDIQVEAQERELFRVIHLLPKDINRNAIVNLVRSRQPASTVIMRFARKN